MDNLDTHEQDNGQTQDDVQSTDTGNAQETQTQNASDFTWKRFVGADFSNSPTMQKFPDTPEGLQKAVGAHLSLEKLLGHDKVPIPKGANDTEGRQRFNKALGVPDKPEGYALEDVSLPGDMSKLTFDKKAFGEIVHKYHLTPDQAKGLWKDYTELSGNVYNQHLQGVQNNLNETMNALRNEWGDAYASKVELGELVINKFADNKEMGDFLTATLSKSPIGIKFLAKIGSEFAENKVGDFKHSRFSMTPDEAQAEYDKITSDPNHPYLNDKSTPAEHDKAVEYVNTLLSRIHRKEGQS